MKAEQDQWFWNFAQWSISIFQQDISGLPRDGRVAQEETVVVLLLVGLLYIGLFL